MIFLYDIIVYVTVYGSFCYYDYLWLFVILYYYYYSYYSRSGGAVRSAGGGVGVVPDMIYAIINWYFLYYSISFFPLNVFMFVYVLC